MRQSEGLPSKPGWGRNNNDLLSREQEWFFLEEETTGMQQQDDQGEGSRRARFSFRPRFEPHSLISLREAASSISLNHMLLRRADAPHLIAGTAAGEGSFPPLPPFFHRQESFDAEGVAVPQLPAIRLNLSYPYPCHFQEQHERGPAGRRRGGGGVSFGKSKSEMLLNILDNAMAILDDDEDEDALGEELVLPSGPAQQ